MRAFLGAVALVVILFMSASPARAQGGVEHQDSWLASTFQGTPFEIPLVSFKRTGGGHGCVPGQCCHTAEFTLLDYADFDVNQLGGQEFEFLIIVEALPVTGRRKSTALVGARVLSVQPATVQGQKGWVISVCYDRQVVSLGGQDLE
jgi:hypothetical protein